MKKLKLLSAIAISLLGASIASCGGNNSTSDVEVVFWTTFNKSMNSEIEEIGSKFSSLIKENEGIDVKVSVTGQGGYDDIQNKIQKGFTSGDLPSLAVAYPDHVANYLASEINKGDYVVKLDEYMDDSEVGFASTSESYLNPSLKGKDDFVPSYLEEGQQYMYDGTYSLPFLKSTEIMIYNADVVSKILSDMGIQQSVTNYMKNLTWDKFMEMLDYIADNKEDYLDVDGDGDVDGVALYYDSDSNFFITQCYQRGLGYVSYDRETQKASVDFNNEEQKAMVEELKELNTKGVLLTKGSNNGLYSSNVFSEGKAIFTVSSSGGSGYSDVGSSFTTGVCKMPAYEEGERAKYVSQGLTLTILNNSTLGKEKNQKRVDYTWKFLKYILNEDNNIDMALTSEGYVPVRESCYTSDYLDYSTFIESTNTKEDYNGACANVVINQMQGNFYNYPVFKGSDGCRDAVESILTNYFLSSNEKTLDELFNEAYSTAIKAIA